MRTFVFMGRNRANKSGMSWKLWKIERRGRTVTVWWGPATVKSHKPVPTNRLQSKSWVQRSENIAMEDVKRRIQEKEKEGYEQVPRSRAPKIINQESKF